MGKGTTELSSDKREVKNTKELRAFNKMSIIDYLRGREMTSKAEVAKALNLSFATVSNLCNELIEERIFKAGQRSTQSGGRPSEQLTLEVRARVSFCIDLTYKEVVRLLLVDLHNNPIREQHISYSESSSMQELVTACSAGFHAMCSEADVRHEQLLGAAVIIPGLFDKQTGGVVNSTLAVLDNYNLGTVLSQMIDSPVYIENDANLAALAVSMQGESQRYDNVLFLYIGEGLGLGILSHGGSIFHGVRGFAGEIAHLPLGHPEYECYCGNTGCVEGILSNTGIERELQSGGNSAEQVGHTLGKVISMLVNLLDPQAVFIGGDREDILRQALPYAQQESARRVLLQRYRDIPITLSSGVHNLFYQGASELLIRKWLMR